MQNVLIGGIGNVMLGDHGTGPFAIKVLESQYAFDSAVKLVQLPASVVDLQPYLSGADIAILINAVDFGGQPGDIRLFRERDMLTPFRALKGEFLLSLQRLDTMPSKLLLIGMQGRRFTPGLQLSTPVRDCIPHVIDAVLRELRSLGVSYLPRPSSRLKAFGSLISQRAA